MSQLPEIYTTKTRCRTFDLTELDDEERQFLEEIFALYHADPPPEWSEFGTGWICQYKERELESEAVYRICQDLEGRLSIVQEKAAKPDYKGCLIELIEQHYKSRYAFCQATGVNEGQLSRVFAGKSQFSIDLLLQILEHLGATLTIIPEQDAADFQLKTQPQIKEE